GRGAAADAQAAELIGEKGKHKRKSAGEPRREAKYSPARQAPALGVRAEMLVPKIPSHIDGGYDRDKRRRRMFSTTSRERRPRTRAQKPTDPRRRGQRGYRPGIEPLEDRIVPTNYSALPADLQSLFNAVQQSLNDHLLAPSVSY